MHVQTGEIISSEEMMRRRATLTEEQFKMYKPMEVDPTPAQLKRIPPRVGRNELCPCGSGKKFKKCCLVKM